AITPSPSANSARRTISPISAADIACSGSRELWVADFSSRSLIERVDIAEQSLVKAQGGENIRLLFTDENLVLQPEAADARLAGIGLDAEEHARLQGNDGVRAEIGDPRRLPWIGSRPVPARHVIGIGIGLRMIQVPADVRIRLADHGLGAGIEQGVVTLLMQVDLLLGGADVTANIGTREISPVAVEAGTDIDDDAIAFTDYAIRRESAIWRGIRAGTHDVGTLAPFAAELGELLPRNGQQLTFFHAGLEIIQESLEARLGDHRHDLLAFDLVSGLDHLGVSESLFAVDELGFGKALGEPLGKSKGQQIDADFSVGELADFPLLLFGPFLGSALGANERPPHDVIGMNPGHARASMRGIQGAQDGIAAARQYSGGKTEYRHRAEMGAESGQVTDILQGEDEQSIEPCLVHCVLGLLQPLAAQPLEIDPFLPINSHHSEF